MRLGLSADQLLTTTRSVRRRLDLERPVPREEIEACLEIAVQAPNGSNRQGWHWVVIDDTEQAKAAKAAIAEIYRCNLAALASAPRAHGLGEPQGDRHARTLESGAHLAAHLHRVPVLLVPCIAGRHDHLSAAGGASVFGSILPAVWSFMLAARERGLGAAWTTVHLVGDGERAVAEVLGIPFESFTQVGLFPVAYTIGTDFRPASRRAAREVTHWGQW